MTEHNIERGPNRAVYMQMADHYRQLITTGALRPGDQLPTLADMAQTAGVSQRTAQKAVNVLRGEKLVEAYRQRGTFVAQGAAASESGQALIANPTGAPSADQVTITSAQVVDCPVYVADILGIEGAEAGNQRVCRREAVTRRDGKPYRLSVSWTAPWAYGAASELTEPVLVNGLRAIARATGRGVSGAQRNRGRDYFMARTADEREARHLGLEAGDVVLAGTSVWSDAEGVLEYREFVVAAHVVVDVEYEFDLAL